VITLPDESLLVQDGKNVPRVVASGVQSAVWLPAAAGTPPNTATTVPSSVTVPDVIGLAQHQATGMLTRLGFNVVVNYSPGGTVRGPRTVLAQSIAPGTSARPGTTVSLTVSPPS
jgi:hypothetical protein